MVGVALKINSSWTEYSLTSHLIDKSESALSSNLKPLKTTFSRQPTRLKLVKRGSRRWRLIKTASFVLTDGCIGEILSASCKPWCWRADVVEVPGWRKFWLKIQNGRGCEEAPELGLLKHSLHHVNKKYSCAKRIAMLATSFFLSTPVFPYLVFFNIFLSFL